MLVGSWSCSCYTHSFAKDFPQILSNLIFPPTIFKLLSWQAKIYIYHTHIIYIYIHTLYIYMYIFIHPTFYPCKVLLNDCLVINISNKSMTYSVAKGNTICFSTWTHIDTRWNYKLWCCPPHCNNPPKRKHLGVLDLKIWDLKCSIFILFLFSGWKRAVFPCSIKPKNASCWKINPERLFSKGSVSSHLLLLASISQETTIAHETIKSHTIFYLKINLWI